MPKTKPLKTFDNLEFKNRYDKMGFATQARLDFPNGYGISVITGVNAHTSVDAPYEAAVFLNKHLCYTTPITGDVKGHLTGKDVTTMMQKIQRLPKEPK